MTTTTIPVESETRRVETAGESGSVWADVLRSRRVLIGGGILFGILGLCLVTLPFTLRSASTFYYDAQDRASLFRTPDWDARSWFGYDQLGRSILARCLLGGTISLAIGAAAATIAVVLGVSVGLLAGYRGGWVDSLLMRLVDILYGLPYVLLVILFKIAFENPLSRWVQPMWANIIVLFGSIGLVSWLTLARVVRGQVLSLRGQPFIEACRALGLKERRIFLRHILPNLVGPITVYATLTVPSAILQESFLSFLGVGINAPLPTWGSLASDAVQQMSPVKLHWWLLIFPCTLLAVTLLSLNFLGDGLRDVFDPKKESAKI
jgi:ABC-type dipeptide/oligopeptide/nickel transport system permease subunit